MSKSKTVVEDQYDEEGNLIGVGQVTEVKEKKPRNFFVKDETDKEILKTLLEDSLSSLDASKTGLGDKLIKGKLEELLAKANESLGL